MSRAVRVRRPGRLSGHPALRRGPHDPAPGASAARPRGSWHPRLLVGLLVLAIRHGDRVALAMDARGFGAGPRTHYRLVRWSWLDGWLAALGVVGRGGRDRARPLASADADPREGRRVPARRRRDPRPARPAIRTRSSPRLRADEPVSWVPVLDGWLVTRARPVHRGHARRGDASPSTTRASRPRRSSGRACSRSTATSIERHRDPFAAAAPAARRSASGSTRPWRMDAGRLVDDLAPTGRAEVRRDLAGPLAVEVVAARARARSTRAGERARLVRRDRRRGRPRVGRRRDRRAAPAAVAALARHVDATIEGGVGVLGRGDRDASSRHEVASNAAVMMFGGIETSEGMTTSPVLARPVATRRRRPPSGRSTLIAERGRGVAAPGAGGRPGRPLRDRGRDPRRRPIRRGDLVIVSLTAANRDPATYVDPDRFDVRLARTRGPT